MVQMHKGHNVYYFDKKLSQLRNIKNPNDFINLDKNECDAIEFLGGEPVEIIEKIKITKLPFRKEDLRYNRLSKRLKS